MLSFGRYAKFITGGKPMSIANSMPCLSDGASNRKLSLKTSERESGNWDLGKIKWEKR